MSYGYTNLGTLARMIRHQTHCLAESLVHDHERDGGGIDGRWAAIERGAGARNGDAGPINGHCGRSNAFGAGGQVEGMKNAAGVHQLDEEE